MKNRFMLAALLAMLALSALWATGAGAEDENGTGCPPAPTDSLPPKKMPLDTEWPKERLLPMRDEVLGIFRRAGQLVHEKCEQPGLTGIVIVAIEISGRTGKVRVLEAVGVERPATVACITKIVNGLRVRPFKTAMMKLKYPFELRG
jgi:hypothetical protein